jgi:hypothetical protein
MRASVYHNIARDDHGRLINFDGYQPGQPLVHVLEADIDPGLGDGTPEELAERIFAACNLAPNKLTGCLRTIATAYRHRGLRNQSPGDVTAIGDGDTRVVMSVDSFGFTRITGALNTVAVSRHGTLPWPAPVWMLHRWDRHDDVVTPHPTDEHAIRQLAGHARSSWAAVAGQPGVPATPPLADQDTVDLYYGPDGSEGGPCGDEEGYSLHRVELASPTPAVPPLTAERDAATAQAERAAADRAAAERARDTALGERDTAREHARDAAETARAAERDRDRLAEDLTRAREELAGQRRERDDAAQQAARAAAERDIARGQAETAETARREAETQRDTALAEARAARDRKNR